MNFLLIWKARKQEQAAQGSSGHKGVSAVPGGCLPEHPETCPREGDDSPEGRELNLCAGRRGWGFCPQRDAHSCTAARLSRVRVGPPSSPWKVRASGPGRPLPGPRRERHPRPASQPTVRTGNSPHPQQGERGLPWSPAHCLPAAEALNPEHRPGSPTARCPAGTPCPRGSRLLLGSVGGPALVTS